MELGYVFFEFCLADTIVAQIELFQVGKRFVQEDTQTVLGQFVAGQNERLHWLIPDVVG